MRPLKEQTIREIEERRDELDGGVVDLAAHVELSKGPRGDLVCDQESDALVGESDDSTSPVEFITENGFSIVRPWESGKTPGPTAERYCFAVSDGFIEREVTIEISRRVVTEISLRTRGRIQVSNSFWISCAERHLANYVSEHADFPEDSELIMEKVDREDILLALRWDGSDE